MEPTRGWRQRALVAGVAAVSLCLVACGGDKGPSEAARSAAPYRASWPLAPGEHRIQAQAGGRRSAPVRVTVYGR